MEPVEILKSNFFKLSALGFFVILMIISMLLFLTDPEVEEKISFPEVNKDEEIEQFVGAPTSLEPTEITDTEKNTLLESLSNPDPKFSRYQNVSSADLNLEALSEPRTGTNGPQPTEGQFRTLCQHSHFNYDDPIVFPGEPGASHLHMYFGNTAVNYATTTESLINTGGGTCQGFEANRTGYWMPALLDGDGNVVVPDSIIVYYKSKKVGQTESEMPQGLKMVAGNTEDASFTHSSYLKWGCGSNGQEETKEGNTIPACPGDEMHAIISFPNCWDGKNLDSQDHRSHMTRSHNDPCPSTHPVRLPMVTYLVYWPGVSNVSGWHISSDGEHHRGSGGTPGSTLHADWYGGWNNEVMRQWTQGCIIASQNCSQGQTGLNTKQLKKVSNLNNYTGNNYLKLPEGSYQPH